MAELRRRVCGGGRMRDMGTVCQSCGLEEACTGFILFPVEMGHCPCFQREDKQMLCAWDLASDPWDQGAFHLG